MHCVRPPLPTRSVSAFTAVCTASTTSLDSAPSAPWSLSVSPGETRLEPARRDKRDLLCISTAMLTLACFLETVVAAWCTLSTKSPFFPCCSNTDASFSAFASSMRWRRTASKTVARRTLTAEAGNEERTLHLYHAQSSQIKSSHVTSRHVTSSQIKSG